MIVTRNISDSATTDPKNVWRMLLVLGIGLLTVSCTSGPSLTRSIVNQPNKAVGMELTYREGSIEYSHPANLSPEILEKILQHIEVQPSSLLEQLVGASTSNQEAFSEEQREFFANNLSAALNHATPLETVTFYWTTPRGNGIWEITSGGLYLQGNDLHLVLPNYRQTVAAKNPPQAFKNQPLSRLGESLYSLKAIAPARQFTHGFPTELWAQQTPHFVFPLNRLADAQISSGSQHEKPVRPRLNSGESIKQRLQTLHELRQEGFISEEEYQNKRQEILEKL